MDAEPYGENRIELFRQVAERLVSRITACKNVAGIILLGGLVRGFVDEFSDLDMTVFLNAQDEQLHAQIYNLGLKEGKRSAIDIDLQIHSVEDMKRWRWKETDRWDFSNAEIAFDPKGEIKKMLTAKLKVPKEFWIRRIIPCSEYIKWYCCPVRDDMGTIAESWIQRGDLISAHYSLTYVIDLLLNAVFALNKEFLPPPKWRIFYSTRLKWLPENYRKSLGEAMSVKSLSKRDFDRRLRAIRRMWHEILSKIEDETGLAPSQMSKYYVQRILGQTHVPFTHVKRTSQTAFS